MSREIDDYGNEVHDFHEDWPDEEWAMKKEVVEVENDPTPEYGVVFICKDGQHLVYKSTDRGECNEIARKAVLNGVVSLENDAGGFEVYNVLRASVRMLNQ